MGRHARAIPRRYRLLLGWPRPRADDSSARRDGLEELNRDLARRHSGYRDEVGPNAYAIFNTLTDVAARPPGSRWLRRGRATIERRAGQWLKDLGSRCRKSGFEFGSYMAELEAARAAKQPASPTPALPRLTPASP